MRIGVLVIVVLLGAGAAGAQPADNECSFPIRLWKMASASMFPTIAVGHNFWMVCMAHTLRGSDTPADSLELAVSAHEIKPGDLIMTRLKSPWSDSIVVARRVIGMPGDRVQVRRGVLVINGTAVQRQRDADRGVEDAGQVVTLQVWRETLPSGASYDVALAESSAATELENTKEIVVPPASFFVLGDNRDNAVDSRITGAVRFGDVLGVVAEGDKTLEDAVGRTTAMILLGQIKPR